jgi:hypothetical protein
MVEGMGLRRVCSSLLIGGSLLCLSACGGDAAPKALTASDKASGLSVSLAGDQVTLKRTSASASGTAGAAGQLSCTDDYKKLVGATAQPAPSQPWYAATLITWPDKAKSTTATLSHSLTGKPDLCIAQSADQQTSVVMYFGADIKSAIEKQQIATQQKQQAGSVDDALKSAAQAAVGGAASGKFPAVATLTQGLTAQGLYVKTAANAAAATETGTIYVLEDGTNTKQIVLSLKGTDGKVRTATQKTTGDPTLK